MDRASRQRTSTFVSPRSATSLRARSTASGASLDAYDFDRGPDALGQQFEAAMRTTPDLYDLAARAYADLIEEPRGFMRKLMRLLL